MQRLIRFPACIAVAVGVSSSTWAAVHDVPPPFRRDVQCMVAVLQKTPDVDQVEAGVLNSDGWVHPFVQYRNSRGGTVRFIAQKPLDSKSTIYFIAFLNGLVPHGMKPPDFGVGEVIRRWHLQCGVSANGLYN